MKTLKTHWIASVFFFLGIVLTLFSALTAKKDVDDNVKKDSDFACSEIKSKIDSRLSAHALMLQTCASFIEHSDKITRVEWKKFIGNLQVDSTLPGIQGIGYSVIVPPAQVSSHETAIRREGYPRYAIQPAGKRDVYTSIIYLEPFTERNQRAFGYDMYSEPIRRQAMAYARDFEKAAISGKVVLKQETGKDVQAGTLMYIPVYEQRMPRTTIEERRKAIRGWVYSPYRMNDLMHGIVGGYETTTGKKIRLEIFDNPFSRPEALLYDSKQAGTIDSTNISILSAETSILFNDHLWHVRLTRYPSQSTEVHYTLAWVIAIGGLLAIVLLAFLYWALINTKSRATAIAESLTKSLKDSEERWQFAMDGSGDGVWDWNTVTGDVSYSHQWKTMMGYDDGDIGTTMDEWKRLVHPHDLQLCLDDLQLHFRKDVPVYRNEHRVLCKDGSYKWVLDRGMVVHWTAEGLPGRVIGTHTDISERKQAEHISAIVLGLSVDLNSLSDIRQSFLYLLNAALKIEGIDSGGIYSIDPADGSLALKYHHGLTPEFIEASSYYAPDSIQALAVQKGKALYGTYSNIIGKLNDVEQAEGLKSLMIVPVMHNQELIAVLNLASHTKEEIPSQTKTVLETMALQFGNAFLRIRTSELLQESKKNFQLLFDTIDDFMFVLDAHGRILSYNSVVSRRLGYTHGELFNKDVLLLHPSDRRGEATTIIGKMLAGTADYCPVPLEAIDGHQIPVETRVTSGTWSGQPALFGISRDVSVRLDAEIKLRESEQRYRGMVESQNDVVVRFNVRKELTFVNDAYCLMIGKTREELLGRSFVPLIHKNDTTVSQNLIEGLARPPYRVRIQDRIMTVRGLRWLEWEDNAILDEFNTIIEIQAVGRDITDGKESIAQLASKNELQNKILFLSNLLAVTTEETLDPILTDVLGHMGGYAGVDRAYIFRLSGDSMSMTNTHEWCAEGIAPQIALLNNIPTDIFPWWMKKLHANELIIVPNVSAMGDEAAEEKKLLESQDIGSVIVVPIFAADSLFGFIGFDYVQQPFKTEIADDAYFLRTISDTIVNAVLRIETNTKVEKSQELLTSLIEHIEIGMLTVTTDGIIEYANSRITELFNFSPEEIIGQSVNLFIPGIVHTEHQHHMEAFLASHATILRMADRSQVKVQKKDGTELFVEITITKILQYPNTKLVVYIHDVTELKRREDTMTYLNKVLETRVEERTKDLVQAKNEIEYELLQLKNAEEQILWQGHLLDEAHDAIIVLDAESTITYCNKSVERLYGWPPNSLSYRKSYNFFETEKSPIILEAFLETTNKGVWQGDIQQRTKNGQAIVVRSHWSLIQGENGTIPKFLVINTDITDKKNLERQYARIQRLENIGTMASGIAHDVNNALGPITMSLGFLRKELYNEKNARVFDLLTSSVNHAGLLVKQILNIGRGVNAPGTRSLQCRHLLTQIVDICKMTFPKTISLSLNAAKDLPLIEIDPTMFEQAVMNLIINARDAMSASGHIIISGINLRQTDSTNQFEEALPHQNFVRISIRDNGAGISPEVLPKIFDNFFTTKSEGKGTGLGLPMVKRIVEETKGLINVTSQVGQGTEICLYFPFTDAGIMKKTETFDNSFTQGHSEYILVVDDEYSFCELSRIQLEANNYHVIQATNGAHAMEILTHSVRPIDVLLTDIQMPLMDGFELISSARISNPSMRIAVMTGDQSEEMLNKIQSFHIDNVLAKPFTEFALQQTINNVLMLNIAEE